MADPSGAAGKRAQAEGAAMLSVRQSSDIGRRMCGAGTAATKEMACRSFRQGCIISLGR